MDDPSEEQRLQADHPQHALQKNGGLADQWYMDDGDIMCHPILVLPFLQDFDVANAGVGAERNPLKTEVIYIVNDLDAAPPEWRIGDVRKMAKTSAVIDGSITLGVAVGSRQFIAHQLLGQADVARATHERVCQDPQTEFAHLREFGGQRYQPHPAGSRHTILQEQRAAEVCDEIGQRSLERPFVGLTEDSMTQATLSAGQSGLSSGGFHRSQTPHPSDEQAFSVTNPTIASLEHPSSASQDEDSDDMDFSAPRQSRLSAPQLQAQLSRHTDRTRLRRPKDTLLSKGAWQQVTRIEVLTPHDNITIVQKRLDNSVLVGGGQCRCCGSFLDPQLEHSRNLQHCRSHARPQRVRSRCGLRLETCRPGHC